MARGRGIKHCPINGVKSESVKGNVGRETHHHRGATLPGCGKKCTSHGKLGEEDAQERSPTWTFWGTAEERSGWCFLEQRLPPVPGSRRKRDDRGPTKCSCKNVSDHRVVEMVQGWLAQDALNGRKNWRSFKMEITDTEKKAFSS